MQIGNGQLKRFIWFIKKNKLTNVKKYFQFRWILPSDQISVFGQNFDGIKINFSEQIPRRFQTNFQQKFFVGFQPYFADFGRYWGWKMKIVEYFDMKIYNEILNYPKCRWTIGRFRWANFRLFASTPSPKFGTLYTDLKPTIILLVCITIHYCISIGWNSRC